MHFLGLGTPQRADGFGADLRSLEAVVPSLAAVLPARGGAPTLVVGKSTVPVVGPEGNGRVLAQGVPLCRYRHRGTPCAMT